MTLDELDRLAAEKVMGFSGENYHGDNDWVFWDGVGKEDILADDWEIEEEKIEITKTQFNKAYTDSENREELWALLKDKSKCG